MMMCTPAKEAVKKIIFSIESLMNELAIRSKTNTNIILQTALTHTKALSGCLKKERKRGNKGGQYE